MAMEPAFDPENGCMLDINGMFVGKTIYVYGKTHEDDDGRVAVNLFCGSDPGDKIALHVNPRFGEKSVVRNTREGGWGHEEREGDFPFKKPGKPFAIWIVCQEDQFVIFINCYKPYATYKHRVPLQFITHVQVEQNCDVKLVCSGIKGMDIPIRVFDAPETPLTIEDPLFNIRNHSITVIGKPTSSDGRFAINFKQEDGTNHFHFNPRMEQQVIVRNTNEGGWGSEERELPFPFPFIEGVPFMVKIKVDKHGFHVEINGAPAFSYEKRVRILKKIRVIDVQGDVEIVKAIVL